MCMFIHMYACIMNTNMNTHMFKYIHACVYTSTCIYYIDMHVHIYIYVCTCMHSMHTQRAHAPILNVNP